MSEEVIRDAEIIQGQDPWVAGSVPHTQLSVSVTATGATDVATLGVPEGVSVFVELFGASGGGAGWGDGTQGGGGGGGGGYARFIVDADQWAAGGSLVIGAAGVGTLAESVNGTPGGASSLTLDGVAVATITGGGGGGADSGVGGAGGVATVTAAVIDQEHTNGAAGETKVPPTHVGGVGGAPGKVGGATGGHGGDDVTHLGTTSGAAGHAIVSWYA